jgi:hypothetical protein
MLKKFLILLLLEALFLPPLWATEKTPAYGKVTRPLSLFRKKTVLAKFSATPGIFGLSELPQTRPGGTDSAELGRFLQETCGTGKTRELSGSDKILGTLGTLASGACAGVAAVQWLDSQNSAGQKVNGGKNSGSNPSAKTI